MKEIIPLYLNGDGTLISSTPSGVSNAGIFYAINPDFRPIPPGAVLFCAKEKDGITTDIGKMYDPFNKDELGTKFIAWYSDVPNTSVLYYKTENGKTTFSLDKTLPGKIHIFTDKDLPISFEENLGRCIPSKKGTSLEKCVKTTNPPSLLAYLEKNIRQPDYLLIFIFIVLFGIALYVYLRDSIR